MLENEVVEKIVRDILSKKHYLTQVENGFQCDVYVEYNDQVSDSQLETITQSNNMKDSFYDVLFEFASDRIGDEEDQLLKEIRKDWDEEQHGDFDLYADFIRELTPEIVDFQFPYDHYLKREVHVNVLVDTGDGNYDYTLNNFASYNAREEDEIEEESSILWLAKQQGYTKEQLHKATKEGEYHNDSKFLESVHIECTNVTSHMNALAFFVRMTLKEFIEFVDDKKSLVVSSDTSCGLYDLWNGAGGPLEISLEKEVEIPFEYISAHTDGARGYGVDEIYGMMGSFWKETVVAVK